MWEKALETETPVTQALVHGLIEGNDYLFRVIAVNKAGQSEPGEASKTFTAKPRFCKYAKFSFFFFLLFITLDVRTIKYIEIFSC